MFIKCMYGWSLHIARVWINRLRLPILHVVSSIGKINISLFAFAPENLASQNGFGSPVPRHPVHLHTQVESEAYSRDSYRFPRQRPCINHVMRHRVSPEYIRSHNCTQLRIDSVHYRECAGTGPVVSGREKRKPFPSVSKWNLLEAKPRSLHLKTFKSEKRESTPFQEPSTPVSVSRGQYKVSTSWRWHTTPPRLTFQARLLHNQKD